MRNIVIISLISLSYACGSPDKRERVSPVAKENDSLEVRHTNDLLSKRFGDPNSPYRNEDSFIVVLQSKLESQWYTPGEKVIIQSRLKLTLQNRPGEPANDFTYITPDGEARKMHAIKAMHLLLFFYNPECEACKETKAALTGSSIISNKIKAKELVILAIYPDKDLSAWHKHLPEMPAGWLHGRDIDEYLYKNDIYDLKAIPTLYLLDRNKRVILKDCMSVGSIEKVLN